MWLPPQHLTKMQSISLANDQNEFHLNSLNTLLTQHLTISSEAGTFELIGLQQSAYSNWQGLPALKNLAQ
jgi:hypothetical protein